MSEDMSDTDTDDKDFNFFDEYGPDDVTNFLVLLHGVHLLVILYLHSRQLIVNRMNERPPEYFSAIFPDFDYQRSRDYQKDVLLLQMFCSIIHFFIISWMTVENISYDIWEATSTGLDYFFERPYSPLLNTAVYTICDFYLTMVIDLPREILFLFLLGVKYGETSITFTRFLMLKLVYSLPFLVTAVFYFVFLTFLWERFKAAIYIIFIPFFVFYTILILVVGFEVQKVMYITVNLPRGKLKQKVEEMSKKSGFTSKDIYLQYRSADNMEMNAYAIKFFCINRVVIFNTLWESVGEEDGKSSETVKLTEEQFLAIIGHELGHAVYYHAMKTTPIHLSLATMHLFVLSKISRMAKVVESQGFTDFLPFVVAYDVANTLLLPLNLMTQPILNAIARNQEIVADFYGARMQSAKSMVEALIKTGNQSQGFPVYDVLFHSFYFSHPLLSERISLLNEFEKVTS